MMSEVALDNAELEAYASPHHHAVSHELCGPRRRLIMGGVAVVVVVLIVIISVVATSDNRAPAAPYASVPPQQEELFVMVTDALNKNGVNTDDFLLKEGYQYKAFDWLSKNANLANMSRTQQLQRFALAALYYATNNIPNTYAVSPGPWINNHLWLTDEEECDWAHVHCDPENKTQKLIFQKNNLSGKLPGDLALIREPLHMLDLTSNLLHLKGNDFQVFDNLHSLKHLDLEDNFLRVQQWIAAQFQSLEQFGRIQSVVQSHEWTSGQWSLGNVAEIE